MLKKLRKSKFHFFFKSSRFFKRVDEVREWNEEFR